MQMIVLGYVDELPAFLLELDEPDREAMQLVGDGAERSTSVRDRSEAQRLDAPLECIVVELRSQVGSLVGSEDVTTDMRCRTETSSARPCGARAARRHGSIDWSLRVRRWGSGGGWA
jgi:hypothetical protein